MPILSVTGRQIQSGFTLAELLISLAILGEIATFTIPKILSSQQNAQKNAVAKEAAAMIAGAYQQAQQNGIVTTSTTMGNLTQYMNYVSVVTSGNVDALPNSGGSTFSCATFICLRMHSGAILMVDITSFSTTSGFVDALIDPDGGETAQKDSIIFLQYYNGRTTNAGAPLGTAYDPTWFSW